MIATGIEGPSDVDVTQIPAAAMAHNTIRAPVLVTAPARVIRPSAGVVPALANAARASTGLDMATPGRANQMEFSVNRIVTTALLIVALAVTVIAPPAPGGVVSCVLALPVASVRPDNVLSTPRFVP